WHSVARETLTAKSLETFWIQCRAIAPGDTCDTAFGAIVARASDDCHISDISMGQQRFFDFCRVDIEPTGDDDFLDTRHEAHEAVFFHDTDITRAEPIAVERLFRGFRLIQVSGKYLRPAHQELAFFAIGHGFIQVLWGSNAYFGIWKWQTDVAGAGLAIHGVAANNRGGFREP